MKVAFFCPQVSPRLRYVLDFLSASWGSKIIICEQPAAFQSIELPAINYSSSPIRNQELHIIPNDLLFQAGIKAVEPTIRVHNQQLLFFADEHEKSALPFDPLAAIFFVLSRYEEYLDFKADAHGRFPATASLQYQHDALAVPVVDQWAQLLAEALQQKFPAFKAQRPAFQFQPTYDIDYAWAFRYKGFLRSLGGYARNLLQANWSEMRQRLAVQSGRQVDPFYTFDLLDQWHDTFNIKPIYFFLLGDYGEFDKNIPHQHPRFQSLIRQLSNRYALGIHPSYASNQHAQQIQVEKARLEAIINKPTKQSRQHFLKLTFPQTYRRLIDAGLTDDYSMGYADAIGFRAGTSQSFPWYDLEKDRTTDLQIHPFQVMDVTLQQYLALTPETALELAIQIAEQVRTHGGTFCTLWHNSSFTDTGEWKAWRSMYQFLLEHLS